MLQNSNGGMLSENFTHPYGYLLKSKIMRKEKEKEKEAEKEKRLFSSPLVVRRSSSEYEESESEEETVNYRLINRKAGSDQIRKYPGEERKRKGKNPISPTCILASS